MSAPLRIGTRVTWKHEKMTGGSIIISSRKGVIRSIASDTATVLQEHNNKPIHLQTHRLKPL